MADRMVGDKRRGPRRVALVAGATGLVGRELVKSLLLRSPEWETVYGVARRPPDHDEDGGKAVVGGCERFRLVRCDLLDRVDTMEKLSQLAGSVTHLFWATWASEFPLDTPECSLQNRAMLSNALDALLLTSPALCHVALQTGTSHYVCAGDDDYSIPYDEERPRGGAHNFYYVLEDLVRERLSKTMGRTRVGWSVHRPGLLLGASRRSHFNLMGCLGVYATVCRHLSLPFTFCGHRRCWEQHYMDASDARLVAQQQIWWATEDEEGEEEEGQAFNAVNDAAFAWKEAWPVLASKFGLTSVLFSETMTYAGVMADKEGAWQEIVEREGLRRSRMQDLANWAFLDSVFRFPSRLLVRRDKARRMGFASTHGEEVTESLLFWVDRMREERLIP